MSLENYEVRYKNKDGLWVIKGIEGIYFPTSREIIEIVDDGWIISTDENENITRDESEDDPKLVLYLKNADIRSLDDIKNINEVAPYLHHFMAYSIPSKTVNLENFWNVWELRLSGACITKIVGLENLKKLNSITLSNTKINSLAGIENLTNINFIDITNTDVSSLEPLKNLKKIQFIHAKNCPIRSLYGITTNPKHIFELLIDPENLCPTGARLYKRAIFRSSIPQKHDFQELFKFYQRSTADLALQYITQKTNPNLELNPLTAQEIERLIHEATHKERKILENSIDNKKLPHDDLVLSKITSRFSVDIAGNNNKILL